MVKKAQWSLIDEVLAYIRKLPRKEIIKIGGKFHEFYIWPEELPMKPAGWDAMSNDERFEYSVAILDRMDRIVGAKATLRYWYVEVKGNSEKDFREFWKDRYKPEELSLWHIYLLGILTGVNIVSILFSIVRIFT